MTLNAETAALMAEFAKGDGVPLEKMSVAQARKLSEDLTSLGLPAVPVSRTEDISLSVEGGEILLRVLTPHAAPRGVILFVHGGGWVIGSAQEWTALGTRIAEATECVVLLPDYRLAPEHAFPVPVEDSWAALQWASSTYALPIIVAGDSAGGNIAAVLAMRARDRGAPALAGQCLIYPVTDFNPVRPSFDAPANQQILTSAGMLWFWDHYLPSPDDRLHPEAAPLRAESFAGLPPTYLLTAEHDVLHDEGVAFGEALKRDGNDLTHDEFPGDTHGFLTLGRVLPSANRAIDRIGQWSMQVLSL